MIYSKRDPTKVKETEIDEKPEDAGSIVDKKDDKVVDNPDDKVGDGSTEEGGEETQDVDETTKPESE